MAGLRWVRVQQQEGQADTTRLRQVAGLGVHNTEIYPLGWSYLKSFFNTIEAFRCGRDVNVWQLVVVTTSALSISMADGLLSSPEQAKHRCVLVAEEEHPVFTALPQELLASVDALLELFAGEEPLWLPVQPTGASRPWYVAANALAEGFGEVGNYLRELWLRPREVPRTL